MQGRRSSEHVARGVGAAAAVLAVGFITLIRARTEPDADTEALADILLLVFLAPAVALLCVVATVCLLIALMRTRGRITPATWLLGLPASLAGVAVLAQAVSGGSTDLDWLLTPDR